MYELQFSKFSSCQLKRSQFILFYSSLSACVAHISTQMLFNAMVFQARAEVREQVSEDSMYLLSVWHNSSNHTGLQGLWVKSVTHSQSHGKLNLNYGLSAGITFPIQSNELSFSALQRKASPVVRLINRGRSSVFSRERNAALASCSCFKYLPRLIREFRLELFLTKMVYDVEQNG